ncbi:MAG: type II toxin-antitoxin system RelE/ParE family toxin [Ruminococcus sp.]|nr:type II toxin-antitoxin system RelE/ParE family toxin [Ruminococcus sp.]
MNYPVTITPQAKNDPADIYDHICYELFAPNTADNQLDRLEKAILELDTFPFKYRLYESETWKTRGLHIMPVDNYVVLYIPDEESSTVTVIRVMYAGRDIEKQLNEDSVFGF